MVHERDCLRHGGYLCRRRRRQLSGFCIGAGWSVPGTFLMCTESSQLRVCALAHVALVGALSGVQAHVVAQRGRLAEAPVAEATHEGFVQCVNAHVRAQVAA